MNHETSGGKRTSRRKFLASVACATAGIAAVPTLMPRASAQEQSKPKPRDETKLRVQLLGTGSPAIDPLDPRGGCCEVVFVGNDILMFDCGMWACDRLLRADIMPWKVDYLFVTHSFHYDHFCDFSAFLLSRHVGLRGGRQERGPLKVFGPTGTVRRADVELKQVWDEDVRASDVIRNKEVEVKDIEDGLVFKTDHWQVTTVHVNHGPNAVAFRLDSEWGSICKGGDVTGAVPLAFSKEAGTKKTDARPRGGLPDPNLTKLSQGVDLLILDADAVHSTPEGVAQAAKESGAKKVVLTHLHNPRWPQGVKEDYAALVSTVKSVYSGEVILGQELMNIAL